MVGQILDVWPFGKNIYSCRGLGSQPLLMGPTSLLLGKEVKEFALRLVDHLPKSTETLPNIGPSHCRGEKKQTPICFDLVKSQPDQTKPHKNLPCLKTSFEFIEDPYKNGNILTEQF